MTTETIRPVRIEDEMRSSYLDYAMSVIVARALPDVRDGLKPVHRRILYAMDETGMRAGTPYRKSARLVGDVMGKYHPHGDAPIYDAMVRLAQDFSMRYPLIDGQGNFGSVDDDPPAAMRYTEARLSAIAQEMLIDIDRDTVDFSSNFDDSLTEPSVLPARLPNLLINGSTGIAVGMTTNIPPHNLTEVCDAIMHLIEHPDAELEDILQFIHGPDFPTGATILGQSGIREAYLTGRGRVVVRANMDVEEARGNRWNLIVTELPYQVNKATLVEKIAFLAKTHKIEGISDIRDESNRVGMRVVIELRREAQVQRVKNNLFKHTALQTAFHINMLALVDRQPETLPIISVLQNFIKHRYEIIRRRSEFEIRKAQARVHILEGLRTAIANMDAVIQLIRSADDADTARQALMQTYSLDHEQAQAILEMQLRRLAALERQRIENEYKTLTDSIAELQTLLSDPTNVLEEVAKETRKLKEQYGDTRRTAIDHQEVSDFTQEELIPHQEVVVTLSQRGYIKCVPADTYRRQHRGGKGVRGQTTREGDSILDHLVTDNHDTLLFFTNKGRVYRMKVYEFHADNSRTTRGTPLVQFLGFREPESETVSALLDVASFQDDSDVLFATRMGEIKRMSLSRLANIRSNGLNTMDLEPGDELVSVRQADDADHVIMVSKDGMSIRFPAAQVRRTSRAAGGVRGMRLRPGDQLVAMDIIDPGAQLLVISQRGYGKPTDMSRYRLQSRAGYGIQTFRITSKSGPIATASIVKEGEDVMIISERGQVTRTNLSELREKSRRTQGVTIVSLPEDDIVVSITSEEPKARHLRDTTPRPAPGNLQPVVEEGTVELDLDDPATNGHQADGSEQ